MENGQVGVRKVRNMAMTDAEVVVSPNEAIDIKHYFNNGPFSRQEFRSTGSVVYTMRREPRFRVRVIPYSAARKRYRFMFTFFSVDRVFELILDKKLPSLGMEAIQEMIDIYATEHTEKFFDEVIQRLPDDVAEECIYKMDDYIKGKNNTQDWMYR